MSNTAERLFYPVKRAVNSALTTDKLFADVDVLEQSYHGAAKVIADELAAENLVLASREDVRLAIEVAYRGQYSDLDNPLNDNDRVEIDNLAATTFTELERSA